MCIVHEMTNFINHSRNYTCVKNKIITINFFRTLSWNDRIDKIMSWIKDEKQPANLVLAYFEEPDRTSHMVIGSHEVQNQILRVDNAVK